MWATRCDGHHTTVNDCVVGTMLAEIEIPKLYDAINNISDNYRMLLF